MFDGLGAVADEGLDGIGALQASRLSRDGYASESGVIIPAQGLLQLMRNVGVPALAGYAVAQIRTNGTTFSRLSILILSSVTVLMAGQRWPLVYLGVSILAALALSGVALSLKRTLSVSALILAVGVAVSVLQRRTLDALNSWSDAVIFGIRDLFERVVLGQSLVPLMSYEKNTYTPGSLMGRSYLDSLATYAPGPGTSFPVEFYMEVTETSSAYTASPDFFTEAYINFGLIGVVLIAFVWGVFLQFLSSRIFSQDRTFHSALMAGVVALFAQSAFTGAVFTVGGSLIFGALWLIVPRVLPWKPHVSSRAEATSVSTNLSKPGSQVDTL